MLYSMLSVSYKRCRETRKIITFKVSVRALLQANGQIGNPQVSGSARQTAVLSGSSTGLARLVTWPAHAALVRETARRTTTDTSAENKRKNESVNIDYVGQRYRSVKIF